jgi:rod shape-determining protein MreB
MVADILQSGVVLTGGGALLKGLPSLLQQELKLPIYIAEDPLSAVVRGTGIILESFEEYRSVLLSIDDHVTVS